MTSKAAAARIPGPSPGGGPSPSPDHTRQATHRDLFAVRENRYLFTAKTQSDVGDYLARLTGVIGVRTHHADHFIPITPDER